MDFLCRAKFPEATSEVDTKLFEYNKYMNKVLQGIRDAANKKAGKYIHYSLTQNIFTYEKIFSLSFDADDRGGC